MVIHNLRVGSTFVRPHEAQPPLVIDADAVLAFPVSSQHFQTVAGRAAQKIQCLRCIQLGQFSFCHGLDVGKAAGCASAEQTLRFCAVEGQNGHLAEFYTIYR